MALPASQTFAPKTLRNDGQEARSRLLDAALALFADQGFAKTSTREIALAAKVNVASISYYFGDKAGLYRAVWTDPRCNPDCDGAAFASPTMALPDVLRAMLLSFVEPLKQGKLIQRSMKLHFREMLEPTGVWQQEIDHNIKPAHMALVAAVCRHLGVTKADDDVHRLCFSIAGLGMMLHVAGDVFAAIRPQLVASPAALDMYGERLLGYALAMVQVEQHRRARVAEVRVKPKTQGAAKPEANQKPQLKAQLKASAPSRPKIPSKIHTL